MIFFFLYVSSHKHLQIISFRYPIFCIWLRQPSRNTVKLWNVISLCLSFCSIYQHNVPFLYQIILTCSEGLISFSLPSAFCTEWPSALDTDAKCDEHFPIKVESTDYVSAGPSVRNPSARVVSLKVSMFACSIKRVLTLSRWFWFNLVSALCILYEIRDLQWYIIASWHPCYLSRETLIVQWPQCKETIPLSLQGLGN